VADPAGGFEAVPGQSAAGIVREYPSAEMQKASLGVDGLPATCYCKRKRPELRLTVRGSTTEPGLEVAAMLHQHTPKVNSPPRYAPLKERLDSQIDRSAGPLECWPFNGLRDKYGYGRIKHMCRRYSVHRLAWTYANDREIPPGLFICHTCDNPPCCNPAHLFLGTCAENVRDAIRKGRFTGRPKGPTGQPHPQKNGTRAQATARRLLQLPSVLDEQPGISVRALSELFGVSNPTVRRDLARLNAAQ
jgi:hypothetical protein